MEEAEIVQYHHRVLNQIVREKFQNPHVRVLMDQVYQRHPTVSFCNRRHIVIWFTFHQKTNFRVLHHARRSLQAQCLLPILRSITQHRMVHHQNQLKLVAKIV